MASLLLLAAMACEPASEPWRTNVPAGELESVRHWGRLLVKGWVADRNTDESVYVAFYVDGVLQHGLTLANERRSDVLAATGRAEFSGFSRWLDVGDGAKQVCVSAVNEGSGDHALLGCQQISGVGGIVGSQIRGWGAYGLGQLGNGTNSSSNVSVEVTTDDTPIDGHQLFGISAGKRHACVEASGVELSARVSCWGSNDKGQLGLGPRAGVATSNLPTGSESLNFYDRGGVSAVAAGGAHTVMFSSGFLADSPPR